MVLILALPLAHQLSHKASTQVMLITREFCAELTSLLLSSSTKRGLNSRRWTIPGYSVLIIASPALYRHETDKMMPWSTKLDLLPDHDKMNSMIKSVRYVALSIHPCQIFRSELTDSRSTDMYPIGSRNKTTLSLRAIRLLTSNFPSTLSTFRQQYTEPVVPSSRC